MKAMRDCANFAGPTIKIKAKIQSEDTLTRLSNLNCCRFSCCLLLINYSEDSVEKPRPQKE